VSLVRMLALGVDGGRVILVDETTGEVKWSVQAHPVEDWSSRVAMSPGGGVMASVGQRDEHWTLLDAASGVVHRVGARHDGTGACICEVPDLGQRLVQEGCPVVAHTGPIRAMEFSPCGQRLATGGLDGAVILWDVHTCQAEQRMLAPSDCVRALSWSADGARLASGSVEK